MAFVFMQLKNTFKLINNNLVVRLLGLYSQYVKERSIVNSIPIFRQYRLLRVTCPFLKMFFRQIGLLLAKTSFFSPNRASFRQNKLLFAKSGFFSLKQASFRQNKLLPAKTSFFSPNRASSRQIELLLAKTSFFSPNRASFRRFLTLSK